MATDQFNMDIPQPSGLFVQLALFEFQTVSIHTNKQGCCAECHRRYMRNYARVRRSARLDIRERERASAYEYYHRNPQSRRESTQRWRLKNPEKVKAANARKSPEKQRVVWKLYYEKHSVALRERSRLRRQLHPEDKRRSQSKRKALRAATLCTLTAREIEEIRSTECLFCGSMQNLTLAHDIPVIRGGSTTQENCFCLCASCNSKMGTKTLAEVGWPGILTLSATM